MAELPSYKQASARKVAGSQRRLDGHLCRDDEDVWEKGLERAGRTVNIRSHLFTVVRRFSCGRATPPNNYGLSSRSTLWLPQTRETEASPLIIGQMVLHTKKPTSKPAATTDMYHSGSLGPLGVLTTRTLLFGIYIYIYTYIHTYIHACMHTYIHTYIHTYKYWKNRKSESQTIGEIPQTPTSLVKAS